MAWYMTNQTRLSSCPYGVRGNWGAEKGGEGRFANRPYESFLRRDELILFREWVPAFGDVCVPHRSAPSPPQRHSPQSSPRTGEEGRGGGDNRWCAQIVRVRGWAGLKPAPTHELIWKMGWGLGGDDVDEAAGDVYQLSDFLALGVGLDTGAGQGHFVDFVLGD